VRIFWLRALTADVPLGSHPAMYRRMEKYPLLGQSPNPFIDPEVAPGGNFFGAEQFPRYARLTLPMRQEIVEILRATRMICRLISASLLADSYSCLNDIKPGNRQLQPRRGRA
jgi:hypothetical protein